MFGTNKLYLILFIVLLLLSMAGTVFLFQQSRDTRNRAVTSGQLICMPIDDSGNITNDKYHYNRIKVKNETNQEIRIKAQTNECDLQNNPSKCEIHKDAIPLIVAAGQELVVSQGLDSRVKYQYLGAGITLNLSTNTPCQKTIQLDVQKDSDFYGSNAVNIPSCYNTVDTRVWEGGIAFTLKSNTESCTTPPTSTPTPPRPTATGIPPTNTPTPPRPTATGIPPTNTPTPPRPTATSSPTPTGTLVPTNTPTSSPMPTATIIPQPTSTTTYLANGPSPTTITTLPQTGLNFPIQGLTIVGVIVILFGLLVLL